MNAVTRASLPLIMICFAFTASVRAETGFGPWNAEVKCGDEQNHSDPYRRRNAVIFSAPQAGAYALVRFFQTVISPQDGPHCRYHPVCSAYGRKAVELYGFLLGATLAGDRILRCNPYNPPARDPVPTRLSGD